MNGTCCGAGNNRRGRQERVQSVRRRAEAVPGDGNVEAGAVHISAPSGHHLHLARPP